MIIRRILNGFNFLALSRQVLRDIPRLRYLMVLPFIVQFVLLFLGLFFGFTQLQILVTEAVVWFGLDPSHLFGAFFYYLALVFSAFVFSILYVYFIYVLSGILNAPFFSIMAEKIIHRRNCAGEDLGWRSGFVKAIRNLGTSLLRSLGLLALGLVLFVCSFIPGLNLIAAFFVFFLLAFDSADYALEAVGTNLRQRLIFLRQMWPEFFGMAAFIGLTALLPGLILVVMPFAVIAAAELVAVEKLSGRLSPGRFDDTKRNSYQNR